MYFNENELTKCQSYCAVSSVHISPSSKLFIYAVDLTGYVVYSIVVQNIQTPETIINVFTTTVPCDSQVVWGNNYTSLLYLTQDDDHRLYRVYHRLVPSSTTEINNNIWKSHKSCTKNDINLSLKKLFTE